MRKLKEKKPLQFQLRVLFRKTYNTAYNLHATAGKTFTIHVNVPTFRKVYIQTGNKSGWYFLGGIVIA